MSKRRAGDSLTGGTHDVNPQVMNMALTMSGADTFTTQSFQLPINRLPGPTGGKAIIIELLKIFWDVTLTIGSTGGTYSTIAALTTSQPTALTDTSKSSASIIDFYQETLLNLGGATTGITSLSIAPAIHDFTDGAGHGILLATDKIWLTVSKQKNMAIQGSRIIHLSCRALYHFRVRQVRKQSRCCRDLSRIHVLPLQGSLPCGVHWNCAEPASRAINFGVI